MKMTHDRDDEALDALFAAARTAAPQDAFLNRLHADADAAIRPRPGPARASAGTSPGWFIRLLPASGLAMATLTGVWIGVAVPETGIFTAENDLDIAAFLPGATLGGFADWETDQ